MRTLSFTILFLGFTPRIALETLDSGQPRIDKIVRLIKESQYAIHDLSRVQARRASIFVWQAFLEAMGDNYDDLKARGFSDDDIQNLPVDELIDSLARWCRRNPA